MTARLIIKALAFVAFGLLAGSAFGKLALLIWADELAAPPDTWRAVVVWKDGQSDVVDHGGTLRDCDRTLAPFNGLSRIEVTYCEKESN